MVFKAIRIYRIEAESKNDAIRNFSVATRLGLSDNYLEVEMVKEDIQSGWMDVVKQQFLGKRK